MQERLLSSKHGLHAERYVAEFFRSHGWGVQELDDHIHDVDLHIQRANQHFIVEVKSVSEARPDRVLPMLSMAILEAKAAAERAGNADALAIVCVPQLPQALASRVLQFAQHFAQGVDVGVLSWRGEQCFSGDELRSLNLLPQEQGRFVDKAPPKAVNLFSDANQWMLKLLLAWELPDGLLNAPKMKFRNGAELAAVAKVSAMSASRFLQQLRSEGFLNDSSSSLHLVRREELFRRWSAAAMRASQEMPCRFLLRIPAEQQIRNVLSKHPEDACLGLFAAADELEVGHVSGVPPYVYVRKLPEVGGADWPGLMASPSGRPDLILRQALFPKSTFMGCINRHGFLVADIFQVWLDVSNHPSRGQEQAELIYQKYLLPLINS